MQKYADYIKQIEIDSLWSGTKHILWNLDRRVNILSGVNGVGKSTILNKVVKGLSAGGEFPSHLLKGVHLKVEPEEAKWIRFDVIRSVDRPLLNSEMISKVDLTLVTELDWQLFQLQRKYLDYQVNIGNRIIAVLQSGEPDAAQKAQALSEPKRMFQDIVDDLFRETGKTIIRTANAAGIRDLYFLGENVDMFNPKTVRSAMGAVFFVHPHCFGDARELYEHLKERDYCVCVTALSQKDYYSQQLPKKIALVMGNEGNGVSRESLEQADRLLTLPMSPEAESLNVAVCAGILIFDILYRR